MGEHNSVATQYSWEKWAERGAAFRYSACYMMVEAVGIRFPCHYAAAGRSLPGRGAGVAGTPAGDVRHGNSLRLRGGMNLRLTSAGETYISSRYAGMVELVDAADSKSAARKSLWVQVPLPVPEKAGGHGESWPLFYLNRASGRVCRQKASAFCLMEWLWVKAADGRCLHLPFFLRGQRAIIFRSVLLPVTGVGTPREAQS